MMDCGVVRSENSSATDEDIKVSLRRRAVRVVKTAEPPTLHRAATTADEVRKYLEGRPGHMGIGNIEPIAVEDLPMEVPCPSSRIQRSRLAMQELGSRMANRSHREAMRQEGLADRMECDQAPVAQPGMLKVWPTPWRQQRKKMNQHGSLS